jgi:hypothetical protein
MSQVHSCRPNRLRHNLPAKREAGGAARGRSNGVPARGHFFCPLRTDVVWTPCNFGWALRLGVGCSCSVVACALRRDEGAFSQRALWAAGPVLACALAARRSSHIRAHIRAHTQLECCPSLHVLARMRLRYQTIVWTVLQRCWHVIKLDDLLQPCCWHVAVTCFVRG